MWPITITLADQADQWESIISVSRKRQQDISLSSVFEQCIGHVEVIASVSTVFFCMSIDAPLIRVLISVN